MRVTTREGHVAAVRAALRHARERVGAGLDLRDLARAARMAPFHFARAFKRLTGRAPAEHLRRLRLTRAALAPRSDGRTLGARAQQAGYADVDGFSRAFRREFGISPGRHRRQGRKCMGKPLDGVTVGFVKVPVSDFARACAFYRDAVGLHEDFAVEAYGWAQYATGTVPICLYQVGRGGGDGTPGGETGIQLRVRDARAAHAHLKDHAGDLLEGDDGTLSFTLTDPDGNALQVTQVA